VKNLILLKNNASKTKLHNLWIELYEVIEIVGEENIIIQKGRRGVNGNCSNIKRNIT
jgi:hypothetical protein